MKDDGVIVIIRGSYNAIDIRKKKELSKEDL